MGNSAVIRQHVEPQQDAVTRGGVDLPALQAVPYSPAVAAVTVGGDQSTGQPKGILALHIAQINQANARGAQGDRVGQRLALVAALPLQPGAGWVRQKTPSSICV